MSHDRPTPAERAASAAHEPRGCHVCMDPDRHGDQALDPLEAENNRLSAEVERLKAALARREPGADQHVVYVRKNHDVCAKCGRLELQLGGDGDIYSADCLCAEVAALTAETERLKLALDSSRATTEFMVATLTAERDAALRLRMDELLGAVAKEREACARLVETIGILSPLTNAGDAGIRRQLAAAIRARKP